MEFRKFWIKHLACGKLSKDVSEANVPSSEPASIILRGGFRAISGLEFQVQNIPKGRELIPNMLNVQEHSYQSK